MAVPIYGRQCIRCGTLMLATDGDGETCAGCAAAENAAEDQGALR